MCEPDLKYHDEESPTVEPEEGLLWRDQAIDYPRSIIDAALIFGKSLGMRYPDERLHWYSGLAPESVAFGASGEGRQQR